MAIKKDAKFLGQLKMELNIAMGVKEIAATKKIIFGSNFLERTYLK